MLMIYSLNWRVLLFKERIPISKRLVVEQYLSDDKKPNQFLFLLIPGTVWGGKLGIRKDQKIQFDYLFLEK